LTPAEARERTDADAVVRTDARAVLLDVREAGEWVAGHAPGAVHAPLSGLAAGAPLPPAAADRPLVVICRSGRRSREAVALLTARGLDAVDVEGGMTAWRAAGLAVGAEGTPE
ncbi:rhodanese-like domain-containing protein, partial [Streptomyces sp. NPDC058464]|uniref:rhodanese-like domain-containing protein n=1 Tax=Streptomyces sp. NPDC058464 TaxID=3346511 RepID=UPI00364B62C5